MCQEVSEVLGTTTRDMCQEVSEVLRTTTRGMCQEVSEVLGTTTTGMCQEVSEVLGTTKMKFLIFFRIPVLTHKDIQKCKYVGYVKNIFCPPTSFLWIHGWVECLS